MPKVRFKGFTDDWEQHQTKEIVKINSGKDYKHLNKGNIPVYGTGGYMLSVDGKLSDKDSIGLGRKGTIDRPQILRAPFWTVDTLFFLTPLNGFNLYFVFSLIRKFNWKKLNEATGVPSLSKSTIEKTKQFTPKQDEQKRIGDLLEKLENTENLYQRKMELYIKLKRVLLQRLFASDDQKFPVIRFADFHDDWEQRKISEISNKTIGGGTPKTSVKEYWNGDLPWLQSSDVLLDQLENVIPNKFITNKAVENSAAKIIPPNSISVVTRVGVGKLAIIPYQYSTSQDFLTFCDLNFDLRFTIYALYKLLKRESGNQQGTSIKGITKKYLMSKSFKIATNEIEQRKIGNIMKAMYEIVALYQNDLKSLNDLKSTLLQNMFI